MALSLARLEAASRPTAPWRVRGGESWSLAEERGSMARSRPKDGSRWRQKPRHRETHRFVRKETTGQPLRLAGPAAVLVRPRVDGHAQRRRTLAVPQWPMDTVSQDGTGPLGLDAYRRRNADAMHHQGCLGCVASALVPLDGLPPSPTNGSFPIKTMGEAGCQQTQARRQAVIFSAHERRQLGQRAPDIFGSLFAKPQPVLAR
jgi:hypothetical protein